MDKRKELKRLKDQMEDDKSLPLRDTGSKLVFGEGNPDTKILFIGEAAGYHESIQGRPFVGNAGRLLDKLLEMISLRREDVFITNMVFFRPPDNRDPFPEELAAFEKYLNQIIDIINPKVFVTLGRFSMGKFLPNVRISSVHGKVFRVNWKGEEKTVVPMYHPAAALRRVDVMDAIKRDFLKLPEITEEASKIEPKQMELV